MDSSFVKAVAGLSEAHIHNIAGREYSDKQLHPVETPTASALRVSTLTGLVDYLEANRDDLPQTDVIIVVEDHKTVHIVSNLDEDWRNRESYVTASPDLPDLHDLYRDSAPGDFIPLLRSGCVATEDRDALVKMCSKITDRTEVSTEDDGVTQSVSLKSGLHRQAEVTTKEEYTLRPYRTFHELPEQPESPFIFRMEKTPRGVTCSLREADGGSWRNTARQAIKDWLSSKLEGWTIIA